MSKIKFNSVDYDVDSSNAKKYSNTVIKNIDKNKEYFIYVNQNSRYIKPKILANALSKLENRGKLYLRLSINKINKENNTVNCTISAYTKVLVNVNDDDSDTIKHYENGLDKLIGRKISIRAELLIDRDGMIEQAIKNNRYKDTFDIVPLE